jgi:acetate---CoA ligase (ADP-forming)
VSRAQAVEAFLRPRSIAVVGANPAVPGRATMLDNLTRLRFEGTAYGVNRRLIENEPFPYVTTLDELPEVPDVVIAAIGAAHVPALVRDAAELGVKAMLVLDGGFSDAGPDGVAAQAELVEAARARGMALAGPNCYGVANLVDRVALFAQPINGDYRAGATALISASGSVLDAFVANSRGVRWSHLVTTGNEADLTVADFLAFLAADDSCTAFGMFLETVRDAAGLWSALRAARAAGKPVVVLRAGRSDASREAAVAHTGALAPSSKLLDAWLRAAGAIVVDSVEELLSTLLLFQTGRRASGHRLALVAGSGGVVQLACDAAEPLELEFPPFAEETVAGISRHVGPYVHVANPLDWWPSPSYDSLYGIAEALIEDPATDIVVAYTQFHIGGPNSPQGDPSLSALGVDKLVAIAERTLKPFVLLDASIVDEGTVDTLAARGIAVLHELGPAMRALAHYAGFGSACEPVSLEEPVPLELPGEASGLAALEFIGRFGSLAPVAEATSPEAAVAAAEELGFPVVAKLGAADSLHKTEAGGVRLGLTSAAEVHAAAADLLRQGDLLLVQAQLSGVELIIGVQNDPLLGGFIVVGLGGIWTEILDDAALRPLGVTPAQVRDMVGELQGFPILNGARGTSPVDLEAFVDLVCRVDEAARRMGPDLDSLDLNPVIVNAAGAWIVDAVVLRRG